MIIDTLPFRLVYEVPGKIEDFAAAEIASGQAHAMPAKRKRCRRPVFDGLPSVKSDVKNERTLHLNEQVAIGGQCEERSLGPPMPRAGVRRFVGQVCLDAVQ